MCRNPTKCGKCWKIGHKGNQFKENVLNPVAPSFWPAAQANRGSHIEPEFADMLKNPKPANSPIMPENRPGKLRVFVDRDDEHQHEVARLEQSVIVHTENLGINFNLSVDKIAEFAAQTKLVIEHEVRISSLSRGRFVILLPAGLAPDTFIEAIPDELWDMGLTFQRWSPLHDANLLNPAYRVILDIVDLPPHLYREKQVVRTVSGFGLYLGSIAREKQEDLATWTAVVAVEELEHVPFHLGFVTAGLEQIAVVQPVMWSRGPVFKREDMPVLPKVFTKPPPKQIITPHAQPSQSRHDDTVDEQIHVSKRVLFEICRDLPEKAIPPELRQIMAGESSTLASWKPIQELLDTNSYTEPSNSRSDRTNQGSDAYTT